MQNASLTDHPIKEVHVTAFGPGWLVGYVFADKEGGLKTMQAVGELLNRMVREGRRTHAEPELEHAASIANMWLDFNMNPLTQMVPGDPDCDACILARQFLRVLEREQMRNAECVAD